MSLKEEGGEEDRKDVAVAAAEGEQRDGEVDGGCSAERRRRRRR